MIFAAPNIESNLIDKLRFTFRFG